MFTHPSCRAEGTREKREARKANRHAIGGDCGEDGAAYQ